MISRDLDHNEKQHEGGFGRPTRVRLYEDVKDWTHTRETEVRRERNGDLDLRALAAALSLEKGMHIRVCGDWDPRSSFTDRGADH